MNGITDVLVILVAYAACLALTVQVRKVLLARSILDRPNERSSHTVPTPRGGGWAILGVLIPGMILAMFFGHAGAAPLWIIASVFLLGAISWQDDRKDVHPGLRLGLHILAALIGSFAFGKAELFSGYLPFLLDRFIMVVGWAWFLNLYNFMDGIDGITSIETVALSSGACLVMTAANIDAPFAHNLTLLLTGSALGFLALNWHPAKIFMGDVGSVPLGFLTGFLLITIAIDGHLFAALILPLYYLADSGITITKRALRREKIWQSHRQHFYQQAAGGAGRHDKVVIWIAFADIALVAAALWAVPNPWTGLITGIAITALLLVKMRSFLTKPESIS